MKRVFIACTSWYSDSAYIIKRKLELMGYEVILPNTINFNKNDMKGIRFSKKKFLLEGNDVDIILVLNFKEFKNNKIYPNHKGIIEFLQENQFYNKKNKIYLYNKIPIIYFNESIECLNLESLNGDIIRIDGSKELFDNNNLLNYFTKQQLISIEKIKDLYARAFIITSIVFKAKKDKNGKPYFDHLFRVSLKLDEEIEQVAALLHDIVEDTDITFKDLLEIGFPLEILEIVKLVTKPDIDTSSMTKDEKLKLYSEEIDSIINSGNIHAIRLKQADMSDNYDKERLKTLSPEKIEWFEKKYGSQLNKLKSVTERNKIL